MQDFVQCNKFMLITPALEGIPPKFGVKFVKATKFCSAGNYSGCFDMYCVKIFFFFFFFFFCFLRNSYPTRYHYIPVGDEQRHSTFFQGIF